MKERKSKTREPLILLFSGDGSERKLTLVLDCAERRYALGTLIDEGGAVYDGAMLISDARNRIVCNCPVSVSAALGLSYPNAQIIYANDKR